MAKIRVAQIKDLSLETVSGAQTITIGTGNSIVPLTAVSPLTETGKVVNGFEVNGNTIKPLFTEISFANYYTKTEVDNAITTATADMATQTWVGTQLADYSTTTQMNSAINTATADMATQTWVGNQFTEKLANYYTKTEVDNAITTATADMATQTWVGTQLADYVKKTDIATAIGTSPVVTKVASEKAVADYVADQLALIDTQAYTAGNGIDITNHVVSAKVKANDQVLSVDANGLQTTIGIEYDADAKEIKLVGIGGAQIGDAIDATDFIKDGMLKSVTLDGTDLVLTWNTDGDPNEDGTKGDVVRVPLGTLVDVYTADEQYITLGTDNKFSHKEQNVDTGVHGSKTSNFEFEIPTVQVDKAGHVTSINKVEVEIPTATTIASTSGEGLATEGAVKTYVDNAFTAQATKHVHQEANATTITLNSTPVSTENSNFDVYQNGIRLNESEFSVSGTTLTITPEVDHVAGDKYLVCYVAKA